MEFNFIQIIFLLFTIVFLYNLIFYIFIFFYFKKLFIKKLNRTLKKLKEFETI